MRYTDRKTHRAKPSFIKVERIENIQMINFVSRLRKLLDAGESEAIALASHKGLTLIIDDSAARETCARYGISLLSTEEVVDQMQPSLPPALRQKFACKGFDLPIRP
jgi:predicted nucleic acid-binding protein